MSTSSNANNKPFQMGCSICRKLNDGICSNFCLLDDAEKKKFVATNKALFREVK